jgi:phosphoribosylformylglycinamidine (FGAM) synthase PurS component
MKKFLAEIDVMPKKEILDPQGKAVTGSMKNLGLSEIQNVRIGKHISLKLKPTAQKPPTQKLTRPAKTYWLT